MVRRIITGALLALSSILLAFSVIGIAAIWIYREPLKEELATRLVEIDLELSQAQATLQSTQKELERALRIVDATQEALDKLAEQTGDAENIFDNIQSTLDDKLIPELKTTRENIDTARTTLESLQSVLQRLGGFIPGVDLNVPDRILVNLITSAKSLDGEIANMEVLATQASTFVSDTSYLVGGDLSETRDSLQNFLTATQDYQQKVAGWREQVARLKEGAPRWIDGTAVGLTLFLAWLALSQFGLILHGIGMQYGENPLWVLRGK